MRPINRRTALGRMLAGAAALGPGAAIAAHGAADAPIRATTGGRDRTEGTTQVVRYVRPQLYSREVVSLQAALADQDVSNIRKFLISGTIDLTAPLPLPANCTIEGEARQGTLIRVPAGTVFSAIDVDGRNGVAIRDLRVGHAGEGALAEPAYGVWIRGASEDVWLDGVEAEGFDIGINVSGAWGTVPGICRSVHLHRCGAFGNGTFGINADDVDVLEIVDCKSHRNLLDGAKLRRKTKNVTLRGGSYNDNGQAWLTDTPSAGDGVDCFAGGDQFTIDGGVFEGNHGNGITIKTDTLTRDRADTFGYVRNVQIVGPRCINNRLGHGLGIYTHPGAELGFGDPALPTVAHASVLGGEYSGNALSGIHLNGRNIAAVAPLVRSNQQYGILVGPRGLYTTITNPIVVANGQLSPGGFYAGIHIQGAHTAVRGGTVVGVDADIVGVEADMAPLNRYHGSNVHIHAEASDVYVDLDFEAYSVERGIRTDMAAGVCVIHQRGALTPNIDLIDGSVGSTYLKTDAADPINAAWRKTSGAPNAAGGWTREAVGTVVAALPAAELTYRGAIVRLEGGVGVADATYVCQKQADESYAWQAL